MVVVTEPGTDTGRLINDGAVEHDLTLAGSAPVVAAARETVELELTVPAEGVAFTCSIRGHVEAGMTGMISTPAAATGSADEAATVDGTTADDAAAATAARPWRPSQPIRPHPPTSCAMRDV